MITDKSKIVDAKSTQDVLAISPRYCSSLPEEHIEAPLKFVPVLRKIGRPKEALSLDQIFDCSIIKKIHPEPPHYYP